MTTKRVAVLGAGGLGRNMVRLIGQKSSLKCVGVCDSGGYAFSADGITADAMEQLPPGVSVAALHEHGRESADSVGEILARRGEIDGIFCALPNLPNDFIPSLARRFAEGGFQGVMVDALKRTSAVEQLIALRDEIAEHGMLYITGAGATPGLLTAAANLAAQSFVEVESVEIRFGVGIANWDAYRATIREDIAHMPGFDVEKARAMSDAEVEAELERRKGLLELENMEHADDIMLELAGVVDRSKVRVGGLVDTRNAKKPLSTNVQVTGITFEGKRSTHTFTLGDETSMAANVNGPALGYMNAGFWLRAAGVTGVMTSADLMPRFPR